MKNYPEKQLKKIKRKRRMKAFYSAIGGVLSAIIGVFLIFYSRNAQLSFIYSLIIAAVLFIISAILFGLMSHNFQPTREEKIYSKGVEGEKDFRKHLDKLEGYKGYGVSLPHGGDIDALLICKKGVFAFEVKNYSGILTCEGDTWRRTKIGRGGGRYEGHVGNPSGEAKRHAQDLENYLLRRGLEVNVEPVVVIANRDAELHCDNCSVPVIKMEELRNFLRREDILTKREIKRIKNAIKKMTQA